MSFVSTRLQWAGLIWSVPPLWSQKKSSTVGSVAIIQSNSSATLAIATMNAEVNRSSIPTIEASEIVETVAMITIPQCTASLFDPGARFSKAPETFRARKAIFGSPVFKDREMYTPDTSCMKRVSVYIKNMCIKQLWSHKVWDFATAFRVRKLFGTFEKRAPGVRFSKALETFRARKAMFSSSVSKNGEVYTPETSWIKQLCNRKVRDFAMAFQARKVSGTFEKRAPGPFRIRGVHMKTGHRERRPVGNGKQILFCRSSWDSIWN